MTITTEYLKANSGLPGPRGNLGLAYKFAEHPDPAVVDECLALIADDTANSPEEFAGLCGVLGWALLNSGDHDGLIAHLRTYARQPSWRIREAVAMAIQELPFASLEERAGFSAELRDGSAFVDRAIVAGLCEPKNLKEPASVGRVYELLYDVTVPLAEAQKLDEGQTALRKALGYGWSVAVVASPEEGKRAFEQLFALPGKHPRWIIAENLKKHRLEKMDAEWVAECRARLTG
jgi:hypothetical protein